MGSGIADRAASARRRRWRNVYERNLIMHTRNVFRLSGVCGLLGGLLWIVVVFLTRLLTPGPEGEGIITELGVLAVPLLVVGLVGLHFRQRRSTGWIGWSGFVLSLVGLVMVFVGLAGMRWLGYNDDSFWLSFEWGLWVVMPVGALLLGSATIRARVLPPWSAWPLLAGAVVALLAFFFFLLRPSADASAAYSTMLVIILALSGLGWITLGGALWARASTSSVPPISRAEPVR